MITIKTSKQTMLTAQTQACAQFVVQEELSGLKEVADYYFPNLFSYFKELDFSGQAGRMVALPVEKDGKVKTLLFVGLGKKKEHVITIEQLRRSVGSLVRALQSRHLLNATLIVPNAEIFGASFAYLAEQITIIATMAAYRFYDFITDEKRKAPQNLTLSLSANSADNELNDGIKRGLIIAESVDLARHWIDLPPSTMTPAFLASKAHAIEREFPALKLTVFDEPEVNAMGMGGLSAVSAGSEQDCKLVILEYKTEKKHAPTLAIVGKGITFDSGGLSIKPATAMEYMKEDMAGAAAVITTMRAVAQLKPDVNVVALAPIAENLPSGAAAKPGDIVRFYNGKTAEIKNTDAEGRLILADALSYAVKHYKPDAIIDIATLTGACAYALGPFFSGLLSQHDAVVAKLMKASELSGDRVWRLPLDNDFKPAVVSDVADLCNSGKGRYKAGTITAAWFLNAFVDDVPWAHLDIAGTAFDVPDISYYDSGATGAGVRLLIELVCNWTK